LPEITNVIKIKFNLFDKLYNANEEIKIENLKPSELIMLSVNTGVTVGMVKTIKNNIAEMHLRIPIVGIKTENIGIARNINNHWRLIGYAELSN